MPLTLGFQGSLSERDTAVFVTLEEAPNSGAASSFVTYMTKTDYAGNWEIDLATAATYLGANKLLMEHRSTIKAIANAVDEAGNITAGVLNTYIMQSDHDAGLLWPNPGEAQITSSGTTDTAVTHLVTDTTRDLIGGVDLLTGTEVMLTLSDGTDTGTYTVFAQSDGRYTLDFEDANTYTEEAGSNFDMTALTHGAQVTAIINSTDDLGNVYTYDSASSDDGVQQDSSDDLAYEFEMSLEGPTLGSDNFVNGGDYELTVAAGVTLNTYADIELGDWNGDGQDEIFAKVNNQAYIDILFLNADGTEITHIEQISTAGTRNYGMTVGDFDENGTDDVFATSSSSTSTSNYISFNTDADPQADSTRNSSKTQDAVGTVAVDLDGDGNLDLIEGAIQNNQDVYIHYGNGSGGFRSTQTFGRSDSNNYVRIGNDHVQRDFNNDGHMDTLIMSGYNGDKVMILFGQGANSNVAVSEYSNSLGSHRALLYADFDGDGAEEVLNVNGKSLLTFDSGTNQWVTKSSDIFGGSSLSAKNSEILDYDGDGDLDLLVSYGTDVYVWLNDGTGNFKDGGDTGIDASNFSYSADSMADGDINDNGTDEKLFYEQTGNTFNVIKNTIAVPANGLGYFDNTADTIRVFVTDAKVGDTIEITHNGADVIDGAATEYVLTQADVDNGYAEITVDLTNVNDGANVAFEITLTDSLGIYTIPTQTAEINVDARVPVAPAVDLDQGANDNYIIADPPVITGTHNDDFDYLWITVSDGTNIATYEPTFIDPAGTWTLDIATATPLANNGADPDYVDGGQININLSAHETTGSFTQAAQAVDFDVSLVAPTLGSDNFVNGGNYELTVAAGVTLNTYADIELGDWNGDGQDEIFAKVNNQAYIDILFLNADGTEITHIEQISTAGTRNYGMTVGDFDENGTDDVFATSSSSTSTSNYISFNTDADPQADSTRNSSKTQDAVGTVAVDLDGDGNLDLIEGAIQNNQDVYIHYGNGSGGFRSTQTFGRSDSNNYVRIGNDHVQRDFNNDGHMDTLIMSGYNGDRVMILFGQGANSNVAVSEYSNSLGSHRALLYADFDGDGAEEVLNVNGKSLLTFDSGTNQWVTKSSDIFGGSSLSAKNSEILDYDGDGDLDLLVSYGTDVYVWLNDGTGNFKDGGDTGIDASNFSYSADSMADGDINDNGTDEKLFYEQTGNTFNVIKNGNIAIPADGSDSFDATNDQMRIFLQNVKVGDTIEITQNSNNVVNGGGTYVLTQADVDNGYADVELDFTNVADGTGIAFDITLTDTNIGRAPVTTTANIDVQPSATPIMAPTQPVYDAGDPLPVNDAVTNQPVGDANGDGVIDAADNHEFTIWFKENASDPSAIEEDDIITFTNLATGEQSAASYVVTSADVQNGYANILAEFTTGISASTNLSDLQIQIEDHNTGNIVVFYGDHNQGNMYVHQAGSIATKHFIIDVDGDTDVIASGEFNVHTDSLDLGSLLNGFVRNTGNGDLWDDLEAQGFVKKSGTTDTTIEIDVNGTGNYTHAVTIEGIDSTNLDEDNLDL